MLKYLDVIVVGGGPGGAMAAKKCAQNGLRTLLLEKKKLPRDKVCTGMLMGDLAPSLIKEQFGEIPQEVLVTPHYLSGYMIHVPGTMPQKIDIKTPISWRKDLDHWLIQKAQEAGAEIWDRAKVTGILEKDTLYEVKLEKNKRGQKLQATFIIGADGGTSVVRKSLFPNLKIAFAQGYRECYEGDLKVEKGYFHVFYLPQLAPYYFSAYHKEDFFLLDMGMKIGELKRVRNEARKFLIDKHGLELGMRPLWRDSCLEPILYRELFSGSFYPVKDNALLVGDAAGLQIPVTGEGIGTALKAGLAAANAVIRASEGKEKAEVSYLREVKELISGLENIYSFSRQIREETTKGTKALSDVLLEAWRQALKVP